MTNFAVSRYRASVGPDTSSGRRREVHSTVLHHWGRDALAGAAHYLTCSGSLASIARCIWPFTILTLYLGRCTSSC